MRVLCYAQHLSGVGHFVRMEAIARGLVDGHDVHLVDGGRPVPRADRGSPPRIPLPVLHRGAHGLVAADGALADALTERAARLRRAVETLRPQVIVVDHYPFSKWELEDEILGMLAAARRTDPRVLVLCSLRDIAPRTSHERGDGATWETRVADRLARHFDGVLVHADPAFTRLDEHVPAAAARATPVHYTGFVAADRSADAVAPSAPPYAVLSCGGGVRGRAFLLAAMAGFRAARAAGGVGPMRLRVFPGLFAGSDEHAALRAAAADGIDVERFSPDFGRALRGSALSISRAGYNTTVQLLQARVPAVVVPDAGMSDQPPRAARLAARGLAAVVAGDPPREAALAEAIATVLARPRPAHDLDLDGVGGTRTVLERLWAERA